MITGNTEATINHLQDLLDTKDEQIKEAYKDEQIKEAYKAINSLRIDAFDNECVNLENDLGEIEELLERALSNNENRGSK